MLETSDVEKMSDWIVSLYDKHGVIPATCNSLIRDNRCCAVGIISKELGSDYGGTEKYLSTFSNLHIGIQHLWGLINGFDGRYNHNLKNSNYLHNYEVGKRTREKLIEKGLM